MRKYVLIIIWKFSSHAAARNCLCMPITLDTTIHASQITTGNWTRPSGQRAGDALKIIRVSAKESIAKSQIL